MAAASIPYTPKPITDIFTKDTDINRRQCKRVVPMKVLALGVGRTGTASLREALRLLGFLDTYHMFNVSVENPPDALLWREALEAKYDGVGKFGVEKWDQLLGHCQAVCDWPAIAFGDELMEAYPEAKVILTTRDPDTWYKSVLRTVHWRATDPELKAIAKWDWAAGLYQPMLHKFWTCFFEGDFVQNGKRVMVEHEAHIKKTVPPEKLLVFRISEGWGPLCKFLDCPVPQMPFPHVNDNSSFVDRCKTRNKMQMLNVLFKVLVFGGSLATAAVLLGMQGVNWAQHSDIIKPFGRLVEV